MNHDPIVIIAYLLLSLLLASAYRLFMPKTFEVSSFFVAFPAAVLSIRLLDEIATLIFGAP